MQTLGVISGPNLMSVQATSTPATGTFGSVEFIAQNDNTIQIRGVVTCMTVTGNQAYIVYRDTLASPFGTVGGFVRVVDNGPAGVTPVDEQTNGRFALQGYNKQIAAGCPFPTAGQQGFHVTNPITSGEIIVTA